MPFIYFLTICLTLVSPSVYTSGQEQSVYRIMFYNTENLFDVLDNSATDDEDFTPEGNMHWTKGRYYRKLNNLSKVIIAVGKWLPPDLAGLCEIENDRVLKDLVFNTPLSKFGYKFIHKESLDRRGIDVALLYNPDRIKIIESRWLTIDTNIVATRDILYAKLEMVHDTFHVFVNHWPSRSSGQIETEKGRMAAALMIRQVTDSILRINQQSNVLIMGDFNDDPGDASLASVLDVQPTTSGWAHPDRVGRLYNLTRIPEKGPVKGTLKFQGNWNAFDQVIVSGAMLLNNLTDKDSFYICTNPFLLEPDDIYLGVKPFRTYSGFKYRGGFSDHLPVYVDITLYTGQSDR